MTPPALSIRSLSKSFLVPRLRPQAKGRADTERKIDPRREPHSRRRDRLHVLKDLSFEVAPGETLGVVGANSSGKTTLLKILAGVMQPDSGEFEAHGRIGALLELGAGFHGDLTGLENIYLNGALIGLGRRYTQNLLAEIIEFSGLERAMGVPLRHYSSGMVVRLGFAIATQLQPDILLLDETFAVGDAAFQAKAVGRIQEMKRQGRTMLIVSHSAELILQLSDRCIWLDEARIAMEGTPADVLTEYHDRYGSDETRATGLLLRITGADEEVDAAAAEASPVRLVGAQVVGAAGEVAGPARDFDGSEGTAGSGPAPVPLASGDALRVDLELEIDTAALGKNEFYLQARFRRDDRYLTAEAMVDLPELNESGAEPDRAAPQRHKLRVEFDPIVLAWGTYDVVIRLVRRVEDKTNNSTSGGGGGATKGSGGGDDDAICLLPVLVGRIELGAAIEITTPNPYVHRLAGNLATTWSAAPSASGTSEPTNTH